MVRKVRGDSRMAVATPSRSPEIDMLSEDSIATSVPVQTPGGDAESCLAGAPPAPSPTMATT